MKRLPSADLQRAIEFLSSPDFATEASLPPHPDYESIARCASEAGAPLAPDVLREAFRLIMRARLVALSKPVRT